MNPMIRRVAQHHLERGGDLQWAVDQLEAVNHILEDVVDVMDLASHEEGAESISEAHKEVAAMVKDVRGPISRDIHKHAEALKRLVGKTRSAAKAPNKLDPSTRSKINRELNRLGLDGNKPFDKAEHGYSAATDVLHDFGIVLTDDINFYLFARPEGRSNLSLEFLNIEYDNGMLNPPSPIPIVNSMLVFAFHQHETGRFEVTAYVS